MSAQQIRPNQIEKTFMQLFSRTTSACLLIVGRRESGKTATGLLIMEMLEKFQIFRTFGSNIKIYSSPFPIEHITNLQDLELWCKTVQGKKLFILDEAGKSLRRRTPMSGLNIQLLDNLQILRKYKLSLIIIAPHQKYIDNAALGSDVLDGVLQKTNFKNPKVGLYQDMFSDEQIFFTNIPMTSVNYDTWDVAPFVLKSPKAIPQFKEQDKRVVWEWCHGKTSKDLGLDTQQIHRIVIKFCKEVMEREHDA